MEQAQEALNLKAFILGATGAVGRELVQELVKSQNWSQVTVVVRRKLEEWETLSDAEKSKLHIILKDNLDSLEDPSQWNLQGYNTVFCCLGTQTKVGKEQFIKVDYTYPLLGGKLASHFKIPHYSLVSSMGANKDSWFLYPKTKGRIEEDLKALKLSNLSIFRPGFLLNRRNDDRLVEKIFSAIPIGPRIEVRDVAKGLRIEAELQHKNPQLEDCIAYSNADIHTIVKTEKYPQKKN